MNRCGLTGGKEPVPLKSVEVELEVRDHVATVVSTLNYENKEDKPLEAVFVFPLPGDAAVCHFSAQIGQTQIVAEVKEKQETHLQVKALSAISHPETRCCSWYPSRRRLAAGCWIQIWLLSWERPARRWRSPNLHCIICNEVCGRSKRSVGLQRAERRPGALRFS